MVVADATLYNANVTANTILLNAESITYAWKNLVETNAVPKSYDVQAVSYIGFEAPTITIRGVIPIDVSIPRGINQKFLTDFATVKTGDITLTVTSGKTGGTNLKGRPTAGYVTTGSNTMLDSVKVQVLGFNISFSAREFKEGEAWEYELQLVETQ